MPDDPPTIPLDYHNPTVNHARPPRLWLAYYIATVLGAIAGLITALIGDAVLDHYKPRSYGHPDEIGIGYVGAGIIWLIFIAIASLIVSALFRLCCGRTIRRSPRFVKTAGAVNGFIGMGIMFTKFLLDDHHLHVNLKFIGYAVVIVNVWLPIFMGILSGTK